MKKKLMSIICMVAMMMGLFTTAFSTQAEAASRKSKVVVPTSISVVGAAQVSVKQGREFELKVKAYPARSEDDFIIWSIKDKSVVAFEDRDHTGDDIDLIAKKPGKTTVTATIKGTKKSKTFTVTVTAKTQKVSKAKIVVDDTHVDVERGEWEDLEARLVGGNLKNRALVYTVANPKIAKVKGGKVYGIKTGFTKVTITAKGDSSIKKVVYIEVEND